MCRQTDLCPVSLWTFYMSPSSLTVCFHLSVCDHILALIPLPVLPNHSLSVVVVVEPVLMNSLHLAKCLLKCFPCHRQTCLKVKGLPLKCSLQLVAFAAAWFTHRRAMCGDVPVVSLKWRITQRCTLRTEIVFVSCTIFAEFIQPQWHFSILFFSIAGIMWI